MTVQEWSKANVTIADMATQQGRKNVARRCSRACDVHASIEDIKACMGNGRPEAVQQGRGKTLALFRQQYDIKLKIRQGVASALKGVYMTDQEFREVCGVPTNEWRRYADEAEFDQNKVKIRGILYWAAPKMVLEMKEIAGVI